MTSYSTKYAKTKDSWLYSVYQDMQDFCHQQYHPCSRRPATPAAEGGGGGGGGGTSAVGAVEDEMLLRERPHERPDGRYQEVRPFGPKYH